MVHCRRCGLDISDGAQKPCPPRGYRRHCSCIFHAACGLVCVKPIPVAPSESPGHRRTREQRTQLDKLAAQLAACWRNRGDDPLAVEILRGLTLAQSLDDAHPIDSHGRCRRWRCTRQWWLPFTRRECSTRVTLAYCRTSDTVTLWFHVFSQLLNTPMSLAAVRVWLTQCHTSKPDTDKPATAPRHRKASSWTAPK